MNQIMSDHNLSDASTKEKQALPFNKFKNKNYKKDHYLKFS